MQKTKAAPVIDVLADAELADFPCVEQITGGLSRSTISLRLASSFLMRFRSARLLERVM